MQVAVGMRLASALMVALALAGKKAFLIDAGVLWDWVGTNIASMHPCTARFLANKGSET